MPVTKIEREIWPLHDGRLAPYLIAGDFLSSANPDIAELPGLAWPPRLHTFLSVSEPEAIDRALAHVNLNDLFPSTFPEDLTAFQLAVVMGKEAHTHACLKMLGQLGDARQYFIGLKLAALFGFSDLFTLILDAPHPGGRVPSAEVTLERIGHGDPALLVAAVKGGQLAIVARLLSFSVVRAKAAGTDPDNHALQQAIARGQTEMALQLLNVPSVLRRVQADYFNELMLAAISGQLPIIEKLLALRPALPWFHSNALSYATTAKHEGILSFLMRQVPIKFIDERDRTKWITQANLAVKYALGEERQALLYELLSIPAVLMAVEPTPLFKSITLPFILAKVEQHMVAKRAHREPDPYDLEGSDALLAFYFLKHLIRRNEARHKDVICFLLSLPRLREKVIHYKSDVMNDIFELALSRRMDDVLYELVKLPHVFDFAESSCQGHFLGQMIVTRHVNERMMQLNVQMSDHARRHPDRPHDVPRDELPIWYYILRYYIRANHPYLRDRIVKLMTIPELKKRLHCAPNKLEGCNELLVLAARVGNHFAVRKLLRQPQVKALAVNNNYYRHLLGLRVDLRAVNDSLMRREARGARNQHPESVCCTIS